jgi:hypothetical protein
MRSLLLAGVVSLAASGVSAASIGAATSRAIVGLEVTSGDANALVVGFSDAMDPNPFLTMDEFAGDPSAVVFDNAISGTGAGDPPLPFDATAQAKATAKGAPFAEAYAFYSGEYDILIENSSMSAIDFMLTVDVQLGAAVETLFMGDMANASSFAFVDYEEGGLFEELFAVDIAATNMFQPIESVSYDSAAAMTTQIVLGSLGAGESASLSIMLGADVDVLSDYSGFTPVPIPVPATILLLPGALALVAAVRVRRRG